MFLFLFITQYNMFQRLLSLHKKLYFKELMALGTVAGVAGGVVNFSEFQFEKVTYYNKLGSLVEKTHNKPELLGRLTELNARAATIKENTSGFFDSIVGGIELGAISVEQHEIVDKLKLFDGVTSNFNPPTHLWLNLNDSLSVGLVKSIVFSGTACSAFMAFYYVTLPLTGFHNAFQQHVNFQVHKQELEKATASQLNKN